MTLPIVAGEIYGQSLLRKRPQKFNLESMMNGTDDPLKSKRDQLANVTQSLQGQYEYEVLPEKKNAP